MKWLQNLFKRNNKRELPLQLKYVDKAESLMLAWAKNENIHIFQIEFIIPFVLSDKSLVVYLFFDTNQRMMEYNSNQTTENVKQKFIDILKKLDYPNDYLPQVSFVIDTDENVRENYDGSYFGRLR